jgi:hypothetical protein
MMNNNDTRVTVGRSFFIQWVVANVVGGAIAFAVAAIVGFVLTFDRQLSRSIEIEVAIQIGALFGGIWGTAQWLVLRRYLSWSGLWIVASMIGSTVGYLLLRQMDGIRPGPFIVLLFGAIIGVCQWFMLRQQPWSALWVFGSMLGAVASGVAYSLGQGSCWGLIEFAPYSAITGVVLIVLLRGDQELTEPRIGPISNVVSHLIVGCTILVIGILVFQALR